MPGPSFIPDAQQNVGLYVPSTNVWDQAQLAELNVNSEEFKLLLIRLYQNINSISLALNLKDSALYDIQEFVNGQMFFVDVPPNAAPEYLRLRNAFRFVMNYGPLPAGITTRPHTIPNISNTWTFTRIYGVGTDNIGLQYYPIGTGGIGAGIITMWVTSVNVVVSNNTGIDFTSSIMVLEYLKN